MIGKPIIPNKLWFIAHKLTSYSIFKFLVLAIIGFLCYNGF